MIIVMMTFVVALEIRIIFSGMLGTVELAATSALINFIYALTMPGIGVQVSFVSVMGALIGENQPDLSWRIYKVNFLPWLAFLLLLCGLMMIFDEGLAFILSGESETADVEIAAMPYASTFAMLIFVNRSVMSPLLAIK